MMTLTPKTLQSVMTDPTVDTTLTMVADMVGLTQGYGGEDRGVRAANDGRVSPMADPVVFKAMYARSVNYLPPPTASVLYEAGKEREGAAGVSGRLQAHVWPHDGDHQS